MMILSYCVVIWSLFMMVKGGKENGIKNRTFVEKYPERSFNVGIAEQSFHPV